MPRFLCALAVVVAAGFLLLCGGAWPATRCMASWYGPESGRVTASGERFRPDGISAAHRTYPFGTRLRVTVVATGRHVVVRINDRGPAAWTGRCLDLSRGAARQLGILGAGTAIVSMEVLR